MNQEQETIEQLEIAKDKLVEVYSKHPDKFHPVVATRYKQALAELQERLDTLYQQL